MNKKLFFFVLFILHISYFILHVPTALAATFKISPNSAIVHQGCDSSVDIVLDATGATTNAADIIIDYDTSKIEILDSDPSQSGIQIKPGNVFQNYFGNVTDTGSGVIRLTGASFTNFFTSTGTFATIQFKSKSTATSGALNIRFTGAGPYNTLDSNIADSNTSNDILSAVENGSFVFNQGSCLTDTTPPTITFISPINNQQLVPATANIQLDISDSSSGVNLNSVQIVLNGVTYLANNSRVTVGGNSSHYTFLLDPIDPILVNQANTLLVRAADLSGNSTQASIVFNQSIQPTSTPTTRPTPSPTGGGSTPRPTQIPATTPAACPTSQCPVCYSTISPTPTPNIADITNDHNSPTIEFIQPQDKQTVDPTTSIQIRISDTDTGVDRNTIKITLNDQLTTLDSPQLKITGNSFGYLFTLQPSPTLSPNVNYRLTVFATDMAHNGLTQSINFNTSTTPSLISKIKIYSHHRLLRQRQV